MASILIVIAVCSAPNLLRAGRLSPVVFGFEAVGWVAVFAFISWYSIAADAFASYCFALLAWIGFFFDSYLEQSPGWIQVSAGAGIATVVLMLPQLLLALLGGSLAQKLKLTIRCAPLGQPQKLDKCIFIGKKAAEEIIIARTY